jgi:hypothetical protein
MSDNDLDNYYNYNNKKLDNSNANETEKRNSN